jgi:hypothetical protein
MPNTVRNKLVDFVLKQAEPRNHVMEEMLKLAVDKLVEANGLEHTAAQLQTIADKLKKDAESKH